jgi:hypothetical protein
MNMKKHLTVAALAAASLFVSVGSAHAATVTLFGTRAEFLTGVGAVPTVTQDFESFATGASLIGVDVLPGISLSTNLDSLTVFNSAGIGKIAFAQSRTQPEALYNINFSSSLPTATPPTPASRFCRRTPPNKIRCSSASSAARR